MEQNKFSKTISFIKSLFSKIAIPCYKELPFIVISIYMMNSLSGNFDEILHILGSPNAYYARIGNFLVLFLFAYIGTIIISYIKQKSIYILCKIFLYLLVISLYAISHFLLQNFGVSITPTYFVLLAETTTNEASEFIQQYILSSAVIPTAKMTTMFLFLIILVELLWWITKSKVSNIPQIITTSIKTFMTFIIILSGAYTSYITWKVFNVESSDHIRFLGVPNDPLYSIFTSILTIKMMEDNMADAIKLNESIHNSKISHISSTDSLNIVVVIGESYIKHHSQLYGYTLKNTPHLYNELKKENLYTFNDVISSSNSTSVSLRNILCCNNSSNNEVWYKYPYFLNIFKSSGYNVYFWSNQIDFAKKETFSFTLNSFLYNPRICKVAYTCRNNKSSKFDNEFVVSFADSINYHSNKHNLILYHLNGQHHGVRERFPHDKFKYFNADSIKRDAPYLGIEEKEYIADYDNATLYNDYVLYNIIDEFRNSNSILVYLSDHGEEVYDYRHQCARDHGPLTPLKLKYQYEIPFMVWCSDIYKEKNPEKVKAIKNAVNRPFISDNLCNMLFNIGGIVTPYYRDSLDLISPNYKCKTRILNNKYVYEDIRYSIDE